jgi:apolipoprotein D and lipocalin family protein
MVVRATVLALLLACARCDGPPPPPLAPSVDLSRMYGGWYIVANIPNWFEDKLVGLYDVYSPRKDGDIAEDFYTHEGSFASPLKHYTVHDWVTPGTHNAGWRVQIFWPLNFPFLILYVDPDYEYALFGCNASRRWATTSRSSAAWSNCPNRWANQGSAVPPARTNNGSGFTRFLWVKVVGCEERPTPRRRACHRTIRLLLRVA